MRYFLEFAYNGTRFCGYQRQPNAISVQETIENALQTLAKTPIEIVGCGRTDTGVHAAQYFAHFDGPDDWAEKKYSWLLSMNALVGYDIAIKDLHAVHAEAHARFDATSRTYFYYLDLEKNPFGRETSTYLPQVHKADFALMQAAAATLLNYTDFETFCKSETDVKTYICLLERAEWVAEGRQWVFKITANRFLRGMIRLIVGMSLQVATGKMTLAELVDAMENKKALKKAYSAPPQGLFLRDIRYPYL